MVLYDLCILLFLFLFRHFKLFMLDFQKLNDCFNCRVYSVDLQKHCMHIVVGDVLARD